MTPSGNRIVTEEDSLTIQCSTHIHTYKAVKIFKNGGILHTTESVQDDTRYTSFVIESVTLSASGNYQCEALFKRGGTRTHNASVFVQRKFTSL